MLQDFLVQFLPRFGISFGRQRVKGKSHWPAQEGAHKRRFMKPISGARFRQSLSSS